MYKEKNLEIIIEYLPRKKTSLWDSLAGCHAYNPIRNLTRLLAGLFAPKSLAKSPTESLSLDYMHDCRRDSLQYSFSNAHW